MLEYLTSAQRMLRVMIFTRIPINIQFSLNSFKRFCSTIKASTIFSLSSGQGKCGVAVIRVSGPQSQTAFQTIACFPDSTPLKPRFAYLRRLKHPKTNDVIDRGLCIWFPGPNSFTGEDSCEFQVHGSSAIIVCLLDALSSMKGLTAAKPGEFTKRAFYAGKMDLTEVEGLADLIHAETEQQRKQALLQADGSLSKLYKNWRQKLIRCVAHVEAYIDFAEDQNIESDILSQIEIELGSVERDIEKHLSDGRRGQMLRHGVRTVIVGAPNVGKSSFMNKICQKPISIVTDVEGTTRDVIESYFNISGYPVIFADTAGLRKNTTDIVEMEGIARARKCVELADFVVLMMSAVEMVNNCCGFDEYKLKYLKSMGLDEVEISDKKMMVVVNKIDLIKDFNETKYARSDRTDVSFVSCKDDLGIVEAVTHITHHLKTLCGEPTANSPNLSQQRHRQLLEECLDCLNKFKDNINHQADLAIAAQHLRMAIRCIGQITGEVNTEEILDVIFKDFCIGK